MSKTPPNALPPGEAILRSLEARGVEVVLDGAGDVVFAAEPDARAFARFVLEAQHETVRSRLWEREAEADDLVERAGILMDSDPELTAEDADWQAALLLQRRRLGEAHPALGRACAAVEAIFDTTPSRIGDRHADQHCRA